MCYNCGTYVATITRKDLIEIYEVREAIECRQTRAVVTHMTKTDRSAFAKHAANQRRIAEAAEAAMREHIRHSMADALSQFDQS